MYGYLDLVDFYGFHVGKYTIPMDGSWVILACLLTEIIGEKSSSAFPSKTTELVKAEMMLGSAANPKTVFDVHVGHSPKHWLVIFPITDSHGTMYGIFTYINIYKNQLVM